MAILISSRQKRWRAALHLLRLACAAAPDDAEAHRARGVLLQRLYHGHLVVEMRGVEAQQSVQVRHIVSVHVQTVNQHTWIRTDISAEVAAFFI